MITPLSIPCNHPGCGHPSTRTAGAPCKNVTTGRIQKRFHASRVNAAREIASDRGLPFTAEVEVEVPVGRSYWHDENERNLYRRDSA